MKMAYKFASALLKARTDLGYTQSEVAEAVSVSIRWYQKIESGRRFPGSVTLVRRVLFLNIDLEELRDVADLVVPVRSSQKNFALR